MRIGVDFDNTIVCYDGLFHRVALEQGLIPASLPANKGGVRDYLRQIGREDDWTAMQGTVYGARMLEASAFPGVLDFFRRAVRRIRHLHRQSQDAPPLPGAEVRPARGGARAGWSATASSTPAASAWARPGVFRADQAGETAADRRDAVYALHRRPAGNAGGAGVSPRGVPDPLRPRRVRRGPARRAVECGPGRKSRRNCWPHENATHLTDERLDGATRLLRAAGFAGSFTADAARREGPTTRCSGWTGRPGSGTQGVLPAPRRPARPARRRILIFDVRLGNGVRALPRPLARDRQAGFALYEYIPGGN